jgi:rod shape-determining protein MreC
MNSRIGLLFSALLVLSLISTRFAPKAPLALSSAVTPLWSVFSTVSLNVRNFLEAMILERDLRTENLSLKNKVGELELRAYQLDLEVKKLEELADIKRTQSPSVFKAAQVIAFNFDALNAELRINKGSADGVQLKMAVTTPQGLVGDVMQVDQHSAMVRTILDPEFRVGIKVAKYETTAVARGVAGRFLRAEDYKNPKVKKGDRVFSSNSSGGAFPLVPIGTVFSVSQTRGDTLGQTLEITPFIDMTALEQVFLLRLP